MSHEACGRFAVQLDSDDLYKGTDALQRIVEVFHREKCAMVVGSYELTDWNLRPLPPGLIDHREWSDENGRNNALRINGLGAPRAFYTPLLRENLFPDVSYGEDYAVGLRFPANIKSVVFTIRFICVVVGKEIPMRHSIWNESIGIMHIKIA